MHFHSLFARGQPGEHLAAPGLRRLAIVLLCLGEIMLPTFARASDLRISHQWAPGVDARDRAARVFVTEVAKRLPHVKISIHPRSSLGIAPAEQYDAMLDGRVEMAIFPLFYLSPRIPELSITLLPGGFPQPRSSRNCSRAPGSPSASRSSARARAFMC